MAGTLYTLGVLCWVAGFVIFGVSGMVGAVVGVSGSVLFGAGAIVGAIRDAQMVMETRIAQAAKDVRGESEAPKPPTQ